jgi:hypothetical protein
VFAAALKAKFGITFTANVQNQRGALAIVNRRVNCKLYDVLLTCGPWHWHSIALSRSSIQCASDLDFC